MKDEEILHLLKKDLAKLAANKINHLPDIAQKAIQALLNTESDFKNEQIRKDIYKGLSLLYHPDKNSGEHSTEIFKIINEIKNNVSILNDIRSSLTIKKNPSHRTQPQQQTHQPEYRDNRFSQNPPKQQQPKQNQQYAQPRYNFNDFWQQQQQAYNYYAKQYNQLISAIELGYRDIAYAYQQISHLQNSSPAIKDHYLKLIMQDYQNIQSYYKNNILEQNPYFLPQQQQIKNLINQNITPLYQQSLFLLKFQPTKPYYYQYSQAQTKSTIPQNVLDQIYITNQAIKYAGQHLYNDEYYKKAITECDTLFAKLETYNNPRIYKTLSTDLQNIKYNKNLLEDLALSLNHLNNNKSNNHDQNKPRYNSPRKH